MAAAPRIVIAPDKFRGSLTAAEVGHHLEVGFARAVPAAVTMVVPIADGGEGTLDAVLTYGFTAATVPVTGPLGEARSARIGLRGATAMIELAEASGLALLDPGAGTALRASSRGVGELVRAALDRGSRELIIGLGGSACTDGGAGMLRALGARLLDDQDRELADGGGALASIQSLDLSGLDTRLESTRITVASDVDNPLLGPSGAAAMFGPQKGAGQHEVELLERALRRWSEVVSRVSGADHSADPGAGAAGGVGFGLMAVLAARLRPGIEVVLELADFPQLLRTAELVVTGEGRLDAQSLHGKAPVGVAAAARAAGVPTVAVVGSSSLKAVEARAAGFIRVYALTDREPDVAVSIAEAGRLLEELAAEVATDLRRSKSEPLRWTEPGIEE